ncbi:MAG: tyrosine-type recombinase/integrase [Acidobacteria bacterium]|nr:tyrosine-type recombinase/integrase [Acidobacteriota bacterium]
MRKSSLYALELLTVYLRERYGLTDWRAVTEDHLWTFLLHLQREHRTPRGRPLKPASLTRWLAVVRCFFQWQHRRGHLVYNPAAHVKLARYDDPLPHVLSESEIARLIEMPDTTTALGLRDRALMEVLYATGIRHRETQRLELYDIDLWAKRLMVRQGKGSRDRLVPLTANAVYWLSRYLSAARPELAPGQPGQRKKGRPMMLPSSSLWLALTGYPLSYVMIEQRIKAYALAARVKANVHTFRHCCATHLLRHGAGIRHIQQLLGHRSLHSTQIYLHLDTADLQRAVARLPQSSLKQ